MWIAAARGSLTDTFERSYELVNAARTLLSAAGVRPGQPGMADLEVLAANLTDQIGRLERQVDRLEYQVNRLTDQVVSLRQYVSGLPPPDHVVYHPHNLEQQQWLLEQQRQLDEQRRLLEQQQLAQQHELEQHRLQEYHRRLLEEQQRLHEQPHHVPPPPPPPPPSMFTGLLMPATPGLPEILPYGTLPPMHSGRVYRIQVGAFSADASWASFAERQVERTGSFSAVREPYFCRQRGHLVRVFVVEHVPAHMVRQVAEQLYYVGFTQIWLRVVE
jgi:hypothetical protein